MNPQPPRKRDRGFFETAPSPPAPLATVAPGTGASLSADQDASAISLLHQDVHIEGPEHLVLAPPGGCAFFASSHVVSSPDSVGTMRSPGGRRAAVKALRETGVQTRVVTTLGRVR